MMSAAYEERGTMMVRVWRPFGLTLAAKDAARVRAGKNSPAFTLLPHRLEHASSIQKLLSTRHSCTCSSYNGMTTLIDEDGHRAKRFKVRAPDV